MRSAKVQWLKWVALKRGESTFIAFLRNLPAASHHNRRPKHSSNPLDIGEAPNDIIKAFKLEEFNLGNKSEVLVTWQNSNYGYALRHEPFKIPEVPFTNGCS